MVVIQDGTYRGFLVRIGRKAWIDIFIISGSTSRYVNPRGTEPVAWGLPYTYLIPIPVPAVRYWDTRSILELRYDSAIPN
jgi:hypothetical protein